MNNYKNNQSHIIISQIHFCLKFRSRPSIVMKFLATIIVLAVALNSCTAHHFFEPGAIHFPLVGIQQSIRSETFASSEVNVTVGKCDQVSDRSLILNLPNLDTMLPPNPYPGFIDSPLVTCLNLASNGITQVVPGSFDRLPSLNYLDLSKNRLQYCDFFNFASQQFSLATLIIEDNRPPLDNIDRTISRSQCFPNLRYLYLRRNAIRKLNFSLKTAFPKLTHLFLSDNNVDSHTFIHSLPSTLTHLYLERNLISNLDCTIIKGLEYLHLDGNIISSICYRSCPTRSIKLEGVQKLKALTLSDNEISEIESCAFQEAKSLAILNLAKNAISEIKVETFETLTLLSELNLDDNRLRSVPNLRNNIKMKTLSIRRNKLQMIRRENFKGMTSLKCLLLGGNSIKSIEAGSFEDLQSLAELDLSDNGLDFIPSDWLRWQWNLHSLDVRGNRFKCLEQMSLSTAPFLSKIHMENNPVTHLSGSIMSKLSPNLVIHLKNDCNLNKRENIRHCYAKCEMDEVRSKNETYSRWINDQ